MSSKTMIVSATPSSIKQQQHKQQHPHRPSDCTMLTSSSTVMSFSEVEDADFSERSSSPTSPTPSHAAATTSSKLLTMNARPVALNHSSKREVSTGNSIGPQISSGTSSIVVPMERQHFLSNCSLPGFLDDDENTNNELLTKDQVISLLESRDARITELEGQLQKQAGEANQRITDLEHQMKIMATQFEQVMRTVSGMISTATPSGTSAATATAITATDPDPARTSSATSSNHQASETGDDPKVQAQPSTKEETLEEEERVRLSLLPRTTSSLLSDNSDSTTTKDDSESTNSYRRKMTTMMMMSDQSNDDDDNDMADDESRSNYIMSSQQRQQQQQCMPLPFLRAEKSSVVSVDVDFQQQMAAALAAKEAYCYDIMDGSGGSGSSGNVTLEEAVKEDYVVKQRESIMQLLDYAKQRATTMLEESQRGCSTSTRDSTISTASSCVAPYKRGSSSPSSLMDYTKARAITETSTNMMEDKYDPLDNRGSKIGSPCRRRGNIMNTEQGGAPLKKASSSPSSLVDYTKQRSNSVALKSTQEPILLSSKKKTSGSSPSLIDYGRGRATAGGVEENQKNASWQQQHPRRRSSRRHSFQPSDNIKPILEESSHPPSPVQPKRNNSHTTVGDGDDAAIAQHQVPNTIRLRRSSSCSMLSMESSSRSNLSFREEDDGEDDGEEGSFLVKSSSKKNRSTRRRKRRSSSVGSLNSNSTRSLLGDYSSLFSKQRPSRGRSPVLSTAQRASNTTKESSDMETSVRWSAIFPNEDKKNRDNTKSREESNNSAPLEHTSATSITMALPPMRRYKTSSGNPTPQRTTNTFEDSSIRSAAKKESIDNDDGLSGASSPPGAAKLRLRSSIKGLRVRSSSPIRDSAKSAAIKGLRVRSSSPIRDSAKSAASVSETAGAMDESNQASYAELKSSRGSRGTNPANLLAGGSHHSYNSLSLEASSNSFSLDASNHSSYAALKSSRGSRGINPANLLLGGGSNHSCNSLSLASLQASNNSLSLDASNHSSYAALKSNRGTRGIKLLPELSGSVTTTSSGNSSVSGLFQGGTKSSTQSRRDGKMRNRSPTGSRQHPLRCATTGSTGSAPSLSDLGQNKKKPVDAAPNASWGERSCPNMSWTRGSAGRNRRRRRNGASSPEGEEGGGNKRSLVRQLSNRGLTRQSSSSALDSNIFLTKTRIRRHKCGGDADGSEPPKTLAKTSPIRLLSRSNSLRNTTGAPKKALRRTSSLKNVLGTHAA